MGASSRKRIDTTQHGHRYVKIRPTVSSSRCIGCWMCAMVCTYDAIQRDLEVQVARKCDLCPDREVPACVTVCPTEAIRLVDQQAA